MLHRGEFRVSIPFDKRSLLISTDEQINVHPEVYVTGSTPRYLPTAPLRVHPPRSFLRSDITPYVRRE